MTVCYLILAHKYPELFKKIAQHILNSGGVCVAHIDKKADIDDFYVEGVSLTSASVKTCVGLVTLL